MALTRGNELSVQGFDGACLRSGLTLAFREHETYLCADHELGKPGTDDRVFVKVDLERVWSLQETVPFVGKELGDPTVRRLVVPLYLAPLLAHLILKLTSGGPEGVSKRDVYIPVRFVFGTLVTHHHLAASHRDVQANGVEMSALLVPMGRFDHDVAVHDAIVVSIQFRCTLSNPRFDSW